MEHPPHHSHHGPSTPRTRVRRQPDLAAYDRSTIHQILDAGLVAHLGVLEEGQPFVLPVGYARDGDSVLIHGSTASRTFKRATGSPVCLTVTLLDGIVFARSVFNSSMNYRSVVILGTATEVVAEQDKVEALRLLSNRLAPGHWDAVRQPSAQELKATSVLRLRLDEAAAKVSAGPPGDDAEDLQLDVWAGVVPVEQLWGKPEPAPELAPGRPVPSYVLSWRPELRQG